MDGIEIFALVVVVIGFASLSIPIVCLINRQKRYCLACKSEAEAVDAGLLGAEQFAESTHLSRERLNHWIADSQENGVEHALEGICQEIQSAIRRLREGARQC